MQVIITFKFAYPCLTLKEGPKVKSDHIRRFAAHDFLLVGFTLQTSRTNNKRDISIFHDQKETPVAAILSFKMRPKIFSVKIL